ncbi:MAG TPA: hypothetical protein DHW82_03145 [Spirochaetia bacterium]|nr:MAG: hypothetical protein A2Y41_04045 [Spirochaetes bacterium GWB1_36_13]HCL55988.1 hypothetical protein [Spirochaetia bacterium]
MRKRRKRIVFQAEFQNAFLIFLIILIYTNHQEKSNFFKIKKYQKRRVFYYILNPEKKNNPL